MRCLVTGGAGFIGSNLTDRLIETGHEVTIIDNMSQGKKENINPKADFIEQNVQDILNYCNYFPKPDVIFHLGALARIQPSFKLPLETFVADSLGTFAMLEYARRYEIKRFVYAASSSAYFDVFANPYAYSKHQGEEHCRLYSEIYGLSTAICRFFNVYGPRMPDEGAYATVVGIFCKQFADGEPLTITGDGEQRRDFTHVYDIVSGLIAASKNEWRAKLFNFGTGVNYSINEVAALFNHPTTYIPKRPGEADKTLAELEETCRLLDWTPTISLTDFVKSIAI